jgi:hypothetical protein
VQRDSAVQFFGSIGTCCNDDVCGLARLFIQSDNAVLQRGYIATTGGNEGADSGHGAIMHDICRLSKSKGFTIYDVQGTIFQTRRLRRGECVASAPASAPRFRRGRLAALSFALYCGVAAKLNKLYLAHRKLYISSLVS